ncbi:MAG: cob(I)yrinic acid a,c-diamide adenosyltransferase [Myxococcota bacterium]
MKIYTRRGDRGETDLFGGERVAKDDQRVAAYGEIDELNAAIGAAAAATAHEGLRDLVQRIQSTLFDIGSHLATPDPAHRAKAGVPCATPEDVAELESAIDRLEDELEPLQSFVLPGGTPAAAAFHLARTVCRRAERALVALDRADPLEEVLLRYVNRLSDLLFTLARVENRRGGVADVAWVGRDR